LSEGFEPIRSYQRIFRPERRLYAVEGRTLPVPGGVPLRWIGWFLGSLVGVLALGSGSLSVIGPIAGVAAIAAFSVGGRAAALLTFGAAMLVLWLSATALALLDWPLRFVVVPVAVATLATQATPDGRRADRFAASWLALQLAPRRQSLGQALPGAGPLSGFGVELWVAPDERAPVLRRGRVRGPAIVSLAAPVAVRRSRLCHRRLIAKPAPSRRDPRGQLLTDRLAIAEGEVLEVRP
jgi:conjugation transfer TcpE-like protein